MILLIDNYDSFVYNLSRYFQELGYAVHVVRHDAISIEAICALNPSHIVLSPGPCGPNEAGLCLEIVSTFFKTTPILGVCLGHQVIGAVFGAKVLRALRPMHGKSSWIHHTGTGIFKRLPNPLKVGRYHSLIVDARDLHSDIDITSRSEEGEVMALAHKKYPLVGVQFHPESILTDHGHALLKNFLEQTSHS